MQASSRGFITKQSTTLKYNFLEWQREDVGSTMKFLASSQQKISITSSSFSSVDSATIITNQLFLLVRLELQAIYLFYAKVSKNIDGYFKIYL